MPYRHATPDAPLAGAEGHELWRQWTAARQRRDRFLAAAAVSSPSVWLAQQTWAWMPAGLVRWGVVMWCTFLVVAGAVVVEERSILRELRRLDSRRERDEDGPG